LRQEINILQVILREFKYATQIAQKLNLPQKDVEEIRVAAMLHDLGKIGISDNILNKPSKLSSDEYEEVKRHPSIGSWILNNIHLSENTLNAINYHHERYDGKGYPLGLSGKDLSLAAQIISLSDAYDAMTSDRPYRIAMSHKKAIEEINKCSYTQFNPELVAVIAQEDMLSSSAM
jgi:HD-GYP domain-containing protein (c-di-GMP phosphodiesterase class II)